MTRDDPDWLTVKEYAKLLRVHERTVRRWIKRGDLDAKQHGKRGELRIKNPSAKTA